MKLDCTYQEAITAAKNANLGQTEPFVKKPRVFTFVPVPEYHDYWKKLGVSKELLHEYSVFNVKYVYCDGEIMWKGSKYNPIFGYDFPTGRTKFYRPLTIDRDRKWSGNATDKDINGLHQLPWYSNLLIVTKSMKDVLVLRSFGFSAIAPQGESNAWEGPIVSTLKKRFEHIVVLYDNDAAGIKFGSKTAEKFGGKVILLKKSKDISDHVLKHGRKYTYKCLKKYIGKCLTS